MSGISRRDFLKYSGAFLSAVAFSSGAKSLAAGQNVDKPNIIVLIFDAMSAHHLSVYGYPRKTTPNFERFAQRATVYHSNYSCANFTSSGTSTILSGLNPMHHRAFNLAGLISRSRVKTNIFSTVGQDYYSVGFSQNVWAANLLRELKPVLDWQIPSSTFSSYPMRILFSESTNSDRLYLYYAFDEFLSRAHRVLNPIPGSISLGFLDGLYSEYLEDENKKDNAGEYPYGVPSNSYYFHYENRIVFAEIAQKIDQLNKSAPFLGYFHFYSPHSPYTPHRDFVGIFKDVPMTKKLQHPLSYFRRSQLEMKTSRDRYDEYIANVDAEFGKLLDTLESAGILENSYLILASDHGEVFERGETGHGTALLYEPVIHTPLIISAPGQTSRVDITSLTSNADLLPTFAHLTGQPIPTEVDGRILPGLGGVDDPERVIFSLEAKENSSFAPLKKMTIAMLKGSYKLIYYSGYPKYDQMYELFNLSTDPEEMKNLIDAEPEIFSRMKDELLTALEEANQPFQRA
jgi:arylsulfatase A-like enzyme